MNTSTRSHDALAPMQEKQTAKALYGVTESRLCRYYAEAARRPGLVGGNPLQVLERRFNNAASQLGFARTCPWARQIVSHRHVPINDRRGISPPTPCTSVRPFARPKLPLGY